MTVAPPFPAPESSLRHRQHPIIREAADRIEAAWARHLDLSPYAMPADLGYVEGTLEGERIAIENRCYETPQLRKLHLELAQVGSSLDILHCVVFPRPEYDLPVFGADMVGGRGQLSMTIADLSPVSGDRRLPEGYETALSALPPLEFAQQRQLPEWGDIFSAHCAFGRPGSDAEARQFVDRVEAFLNLHGQQSRAAEPVSADRQAELAEGQRRYCRQQLQNDKTRRVLEKAFGDAWAERYMTTVLFDFV